MNENPRQKLLKIKQKAEKTKNFELVKKIETKIKEYDEKTQKVNGKQSIEKTEITPPLSNLFTKNEETKEKEEVDYEAMYKKYKEDIKQKEENVEDEEDSDKVVEEEIESPLSERFPLTPVEPEEKSLLERIRNIQREIHTKRFRLDDLQLLVKEVWRLRQLISTRISEMQEKIY